MESNGREDDIPLKKSSIGFKTLDKPEPRTDARQVQG